METNSEASRTEQVLSPWVTLVTRRMQLAGVPDIQSFHSFKQADYVTLFAVAADGRIPIIRQYRPALGRFTLELPSGLLDAGEQPAQAAVRELWEETGLAAGPDLEVLGGMAADSGRLENRLWSFFTSGAVPGPAGWQPDPQLECRLVSKRELKGLILNGQFEHALHLAVMAQAMIRGHFSFD